MLIIQCVYNVENHIHRSHKYVFNVYIINLDMTTKNQMKLLYIKFRVMQHNYSSMIYVVKIMTPSDLEQILIVARCSLKSC